MKLIRNLILGFLTALLLSAAAFAAEGTAHVKLIQEGYLPSECGENDVFLQEDSVLMQRLEAGLLNVDEEINISDLHVTVEECTQAYHLIVNHDVRLFYCSGAFSYSYRETAKDIVVSVYPQYKALGKLCTKTEVLAYREDFAAEIKSILAGVDESWSDMESVLYLHDYLVTHFRYDLTYKVSNPYDFLKSGRGICQAYFLLLKQLLNELEIENDYAESEEMNHVWTLVKLDGEWYHLDATWDDPTPVFARPLTDSEMEQYAPTDYLQARHNNFLCSDAEIAATGHHDWYCAGGQTCTSTAYDGSFIKSVIAPFVPLNGSWYYLRFIPRADEYSWPHIYLLSVTGSQLYETAPTARQELELEELWRPSEKSYWPNAYAGLGEFDGFLIYNTPTAIMAYDPMTQTAKTLFEPDTEANEIYGSACVNGVVSYYRAPDPNTDPEELLTLQLPPLRPVSVAEKKISDGKLNLTVKLSLTQEDQTQANAVLGVYQPDGRLCAVRIAELTLSENGNTVSYSGVDAPTGCILKIMILRKAGDLPIYGITA